MRVWCLALSAVIAVIAATLFPLWPAEMRVGVYYLSVAAGCFVASILLLAVGEYRFCFKVKNLIYVILPSLFVRCPPLQELFHSTFIFKDGTFFLSISFYLLSI